MKKIFAYTGSEPCRDRLIDGLSRFNGVTSFYKTAIKGEKEISTFHTVCEPAELKVKASGIQNSGYTGLALCSSAAPSFPDGDGVLYCDGYSAAVTSGYIENLDELKKALLNLPVNACGDEVMLELFSRFENEGALKGLAAATEKTEGSPTAVLIRSDGDEIFCHAGESPLVIGICADGIAVSSELYALSGIAKRYTVIENGELAKITKERALIYNSQLKRIKKPLGAMPDIPDRRSFERLGDELFYLPLSLREVLSKTVNGSELKFDGFSLTKHGAEKIKRIILTGSGTAFNAAAAGAAYMEELSDIPCSAVPCAELRYAPLTFDRSALVIAVSVTGEEPDAAACVKRAREFGAKTLCVTGAPYSYLARCCDRVISTGCSCFENGTDVQAYASLLLILTLLALKLGRVSGIISDIYLSVALKMAEMLPGKISSALKLAPVFSDLSGRKSRLIFTGICADFRLCRALAYETRRIAGVFSESRQLSELVHETDGFIQNAKIAALITNRSHLHTALKYLSDLKSRGADIALLVSADAEDGITGYEKIFPFPESIPLFNGITACAFICASAASEESDEDGARGQAV